MCKKTGFRLDDDYKQACWILDVKIPEKPTDVQRVKAITEHHLERFI
jgi:hypothetical protein